MIRFAFLLLFLVFSQVTLGQKKHALVVAIGEYNPLDGKGWKKISSVNDTSYLLPALRKQGFEKENIQVILDEEGTIENIRVALNGLISKIGEKDIVFIHFSTHGAQIEDDNGDELDGLDEAIVTYNAISPRFSTDFKKDSKNYLRDDELGAFIDKIRRKAGQSGDVLVIMDNCHSGSGTRNVGLTRGGEAPLISKPINYSNQKRDEHIALEAAKSEVGLAPQVIISASRADQLNTEIKINGQGVGSLSYAVGKALLNLDPTSTYQGFFSKIQGEMNYWVPKQHPVLEGNGVSRKFWGGEFRPTPAYFQLIKAEDYDYVTIDGGIVSGLTIGTEVHLYPVDTYDTTKVKVISKGKIETIDNYRSDVSLSTNLPELTTAYWAFVKKLNFPIPAFAISFEPEKAHAEIKLNGNRIKEVEAALTQNELIDQQAKPALRFVNKNGSETLVDVRTDFLFYSIDPKNTLKDELNKAIQKYAQYDFLKSYVVADTNFKVSVRLIPDPDNTSENLVKGAYQFKVSEKFRMEIINHSKFDIFFNVIDLEPTGGINAIYPNKSEKIYSEELKVKAGDTLIVRHPITLLDPAGEEVFKVFISKSKLDLEFIADSKGEKTRNMMADMEKVFRSSYKPNTRGTLGSKEGVVMNIPFTIIPK